MKHIIGEKVEFLGYLNMQTSTMLKSGSAVPRHLVKDANTRPTTIGQLKVIFIDTFSFLRRLCNIYPMDDRAESAGAALAEPRVLVARDLDTLQKTGGGLTGDGRQVE